MNRCAWILSWIMLGATWARAQPPALSARIETAPLALVAPERYAVSEVLEPVRKVTLIAPEDGVVRGLDAHLGMAMREGAEVAQLDRTEALTRLKIAQAILQGKKAAAARSPNDVAQAELEEAEGRAELAQFQLDRLTIRAPFAGLIVATPVAIGQYVLKGTVIAELADVTSLRSRQAVDRRQTKVGSRLSLEVEDRTVEARVQAVVALPEDYRNLLELATPLALAWVVLPNPAGELAPGMRVHSRVIPRDPVTVLPRQAIKQEEQGGKSYVQVIRNDYVTNVPVMILGGQGSDRLQVAGAFRSVDSLVVSTSRPLLAGTLVRFGAAGAGVEGVAPPPNASGATAVLEGGSGVNYGGTPPPGAVPRPATGTGSNRTRTRTPPPARSGSNEPF